MLRSELLAKLCPFFSRVIVPGSGSASGPSRHAHFHKILCQGDACAAYSESERREYYDGGHGQWMNRDSSRGRVNELVAQGYTEEFEPGTHRVRLYKIPDEPYAHCARLEGGSRWEG